MPTTTTNFGWTVPSDTDLVKDGAAAIRTALGGVDTSMVDLKGGTTGQVLAKATGTDMDFTWVAQDDSNAIQNSIVDAKGDLIAATANDTPARLAIGTNNQVLTADSAQATGMKWATPASGGMTLLSTGTMSTNLMTFSVSAGYNNVMLIVQGASLSTAEQFYARINTFNSAAYNGSYTTRQGTTGGTIYTNATNNATSLLIDGTCTGGSDINIVFQVFNVDVAQNHAFTYNTNWVSGLGESTQNWGGKLNQASAVTALNLGTLGAATWAGGTYYLYGVK